MKKLSLFAITAVLLLAFNISAIAAERPSEGSLNGEAVVLMNAENGQVLYEKNKDATMYPASITKIMTGMLALQDGNLQDILTTSRNAVYSLPYNTSHIALTTDEQITLEQALYALSIESANDAANVIAEHFGGSNQGFAQRMNDYAKQLGAVNTNFTNLTKAINR